MKDLLKTAMWAGDIYEEASEAVKYSEEFVTFNRDKMRKLLLEFYEDGFHDGYRTARGDKRDEWGCWLEGKE